jgi:hypothetical protein
MADTFESFAEAIRQANEAYAAAMMALSRAVQNLPATRPVVAPDAMVETVLSVARMSKDSVIAAIEQGFELWERQVRRISGTAVEATSKPAVEPPATRPNVATSNPMEAWAENWRSATAALMPAGNEELRKQAESVQNAFVEGIRAWQRLWQPEKH